MAHRLDHPLSIDGAVGAALDFAVAAKAISAATNATPIVVTSTAHGFVDGQVVNITGVTVNTAVNGVFIVASKADDTFALTDRDGVDIAGNGVYGTGGSIWPVACATPAVGDAFDIERINIIAGNNSAPTSGEYVGEPALSVGMKLQVRRGSGIVSDLTPQAVTFWNQWALYAGVDVPLTDLTAGHVDASARWTFSKSAHEDALFIGPTDWLCLIVSDDLSALVYHQACVQGHEFAVA